MNRRLVPEYPALSTVASAAGGYLAMAEKAAEGMRAPPGFGEPEVWRHERSWEFTLPGGSGLAYA